MKKTILSVAILVASLTSLKAQNVDIIPKVGINIGTQSVSSLSGEKSKTGFSGGVAFDIRSQRSQFSFQPELNFVSKGIRFKNDNVTTSYNFNYIEMPLLAKYRFDILYVAAGPSLGFQLNGSNRFSALYGSKPKTVDIGLQFGVGAAIPMAYGKFILDARYALGLTDISKGAGTVRNRGLNITLGYAIPLK
ncbi:porin family protein [Pedobacter suwonensis]|uniref:porin family protein n=1 Tax=Pedobacter suwonensis TaxID=332999 RepID=UPI0036C68DC3